MFKQNIILITLISICLNCTDICYFKVFRSNDVLLFCSLYSANWLLLVQCNTHRKCFHECYWNCQFQVTYYVSLLTICCNFLSLKFSGYLTGQHMNKYSNVIINFSIIMNLKRLVKNLIWQPWYEFVLRNLLIFLLVFLMTMHQSRNYWKRRNHWHFIDKP